MKLKKEFIWGLVTGLMVAGSLPLASLANQMVSAMRTNQTIILDGETVDWTVYNVLDENYIRLADLCSELGVGLVWDPGANAVRMNSDGSVPETTPAPATPTYYSASPTEEPIPFPMPDLSYFSASTAQSIEEQVNSWANMAVYGILGGYMNLNTENYLLPVTAATLIDANGERYFMKDGQAIDGIQLSPVSAYSEAYGQMEAMTFVYALETKDQEILAIRVDVAGSLYNGEIHFNNVKILATYSGSPDYFYRCYSDDGGYYLLFRETRENLNTNNWDFPAYHYGSHAMTDEFIAAVWDDNGTVIGWQTW